MHNRWYTSIPSWRPEELSSKNCVHTCRSIYQLTVDIVIMNEHADRGGIIYRSSRVNSLFRKNHQAPASRVQIGGGSRSILSNVSLLLLCNMCARTNLSFVPSEYGAQHTSEARCNGNVASRTGRRGKERDVSLWDNPPLLGADYGLPAPNMAALLFNVRLMGSSLSRTSLRRITHCTGSWWSQLCSQLGETEPALYASPCYFLSFFSFRFLLYSNRQVFFHDMELYTLVTTPWYISACVILVIDYCIRNFYTRV